MQPSILQLLLSSLLTLLGLSSEQTQQQINFLQEKNQIETQFKQWKNKYNINFDLAENTQRQDIYQNNLKKIQQHNSQNHSYTLGENQFMHLTPEEFVAIHTNQQSTQKNLIYQQQFSSQQIPQNLDWRQQGKVSQVKNQRECKASWAFSAVSAMESANAIKTGQMTLLSEQYVIDCDSDTDHGCLGGWMDHAYSYVSDFGMPKEIDYPFIGIQKKCSENYDHYYGNKNYVDLLPNQPQQLLEALQKNPVTVGVQLCQEFQLYQSGIFNHDCGTRIDYGLLVVGYQTDESGDYWIMKNSLGVDWGEQGYIRMLKDETQGPGICGMYQAMSYPISS